MSFNEIVVDSNGFIIALKRNGEILNRYVYDEYLKNKKEQCDDYKCDYYNENDIDLLDMFDNAEDKGCDCYESY